MAHAVLSTRLPKHLFFIIGAPRSGTTAMFEWLATHPHVFTTSDKEPAFFALAGSPELFRGPGDKQGTRDPCAYVELFAGAEPGHLAGEASTLYLSSPDAPARIRGIAPNSKLIAVLRNPVERAYSQYLQHRRDQREPIDDFSVALEDEDARLAAGWSPFWAYRGLGLYAESIRRYQQIFPSEQFKVLLYDDIVRDPHRVLFEVLEFLNLEPWPPPDLATRRNRSGTPRYPRLHRFANRDTGLKRLVRRHLPHRIRRFAAETVSSILDRQLLPSPPLSPRVRAQLGAFYADDLRALEDLLQRDLSTWASRSVRSVSSH